MSASQRAERGRLAIRAPNSTCRGIHRSSGAASWGPQSAIRRRFIHQRRRTERAAAAHGRSLRRPSFQGCDRATRLGRREWPLVAVRFGTVPIFISRICSASRHLRIDPGERTSPSDPGRLSARPSRRRGQAKRTQAGVRLPGCRTTVTRPCLAPAVTALICAVTGLTPDGDGHNSGSLASGLRASWFPAGGVIKALFHGALRLINIQRG